MCLDSNCPMPDIVPFNKYIFPVSNRIPILFSNDGFHRSNLTLSLPGTRYAFATKLARQLVRETSATDGRDPTSLRTPEKAGSPLTAGDVIDPAASIPCFDASGPVRTTVSIIMRNAEVRATERSTASAQRHSQQTTLQIQ